MSDPLAVDLFVEDHAHEMFVEALVRRIAREVNVEVSPQARSARGGHARALSEFRAYQRLVQSRRLGLRSPDLVVVAIDGNCSTPREKRKEIEKATLPRFPGRIVSACPDPHVERWFLADPDSFHAVVGCRPSVGSRKCERRHYKRLLADAVRHGQQPATLGGLEFAVELVTAMDLYRAGKADPSLKAFIGDLRAGLRELSATAGQAARRRTDP